MSAILLHGPSEVRNLIITSCVSPWPFDNVRGQFANHVPLLYITILSIYYTGQNKLSPMSMFSIGAMLICQS